MGGAWNGSSFRHMAEFARLIMFDRRGTGLSDPVSEPPTLEQQVDDLRAVLDAVGSERTAMIGGSDLGLSALFAATYPEKVSALVLSGVAVDGRHTFADTGRERMLEAIEESWGDGTLVSLYAPSHAGDPAFAEWWGRMQRSALSPGMARKIWDMTAHTNLRAVLPLIRAPTLVTHARGDRMVPVERGREVAALIPGARFVEYPGEDAYFWNDPPGLAELEEFLTGRRSAPRVDRVLSTVLFTDIVGSTERLSELGDARWRRQLGEHNLAVRTAPSAGEDTRSRPAGMASWPPSTVPHAPPVAPLRSSPRSTRSACRCGPGCTPANANSARTMWPESPSTSPRA